MNGAMRQAQPATILVTGGAGYIGSHAVVELQAAGYAVTIVDNLCNSRPDTLDHIERISGVRPGFAELDIRDGAGLRALFARQPIAAVVHFAGLKAVGESVDDPLRYFDNNVHGSLALFSAMRDAGVKCLVFSSSATVYGNPSRVPIAEDAPLRVTNPYGRSKLMIEDMLRDLAQSDPDWRIALLRYFNPVGAHPSGLLGEDPRGVPNNLMPYALKVAAGLYPRLDVFGDDYSTPDGTGVRDYVHVVDLALGHVAALRTLEAQAGVLTVNLGTGKGSSVMELIHTLAEVSGRPVPYRVVGRRPGDVAQCYADAHRAHELLGWKSQRDLRQMCADSWNWRKNRAETP
ncbi:MAG TPA: UDP-glucose 4-epimerase GalE [Burkholderiales bacterium]|jgi:UDP-glucose 4-epimerase|nr:UDP-glucose 4-epimerase GalE [Burkholderiales bacterium]